MEMDKDKEVHVRNRNRVRDNSRAIEIIKYCSGDISPVKVGTRIFSIRKAHSLTQDDMAKQLNLSVSGLRRLEAGESFPNGLTLVRLHEVYGVDLLWLLYGTHTSHMDILTSLSAETDDVKFDVFTRLFSYFAARDCKSFIPAHGKCAGVEHFSEWDGTFYKPASAALKTAEELVYEDGACFDFKKQKEYIETYMPEASDTLLKLKELFD